MQSSPTAPNNDYELFLQAMSLSDAQERQRFLEQACRGDAQLRNRVEKLLAIDAESDEGVIDRASERLRLGAVQPTESTLLNKPIDPASPPQIGPYKVLERIGSGGMGIVFLAAQSEPIRRKVALKIVKPGMDSRQIISRFEAERQALALMSHPNIARVYDAGTTDTGLPYFVMELVKGVPITEFCDQHQYSLTQRLELFETVCQAVQHAHQKGVIHRDLKPSNILVELHDVHPVPKIIDFGVAKAIDQPLTDATLHTGFSQMVGTPMYMSPEQAQLSSLDVDTRSDVYTLGVLLYELVTGTTPINRETIRQIGFDEVCRRIREEDPVRPSILVSTLEARSTRTRDDDVSRSRSAWQFAKVRSELDWVVMRALEKDRSRRYQTALDFAADIDRYLLGEPVEAHPPSLAYRVRKWIGRHQVSAGVALATCLAILLSSVLLWRENRKTVAALELAEYERQRAVEQTGMAEQHLAFALDAVDDMYVDVATVWLDEGNTPTNLQGEFLTQAAMYYEYVMALPRDSAADDLRTATACERYAKLADFLGVPDRAIAAITQAIELRQQLAAQQPNDTQRKTNLLRCLATRASLAMAQGDLESAGVDYAAGSKLLPGLDDLLPSSKEFVPSVVYFQHGLAEYQLRRGDLNQAEAFATAIADQLNTADSQRYSTQTATIINHLLRSRIAQQQGDLGQAEELAVEGQTRCRDLRNAISDDRQVYKLEADLLEQRAALDESRGDLDAAEDKLRQALEQRRLMTRSRQVPALAMVPVTAVDDQRWDSVAFYEFNETQLALARVLMQKKRPYDAEYQLGQSALTSGVLVGDQPQLLKHHVLEANTWAMAWQLLQSERPAESRDALEFAIRIWKQILVQFPHARSYRSGVHGPLDDFEWFRSIIGSEGLAKLDNNDAIPKREGFHKAPETAFEDYARARAWLEAERFPTALRFFEASAERRSQDLAYPWLHLAQTHECMGQHDLAIEWLNKAEAAMKEMVNPPVELQDLYTSTKQQIENNIQSDVTESSESNGGN